MRLLYIIVKKMILKPVYTFDDQDLRFIGKRGSYLYFTRQQESEHIGLPGVLNRLIIQLSIP